MARATIKLFAVVLGVSLTCSLMVTSAAVLLKDRQQRNQRLHNVQHLLTLADIPASAEDDPLKLFQERIEPMLVDLLLGRAVEPPGPEFQELIALDHYRMARVAKHAVAVPKEQDLAGIGQRSRYAPVYLAKGSDGTYSRVILPIYGRGLWSTLQGYLALKPDLITIAGITFHQHRETPGLGGEVDNPRWKASWNGKRAFDPMGRVAIRVIKGTVDRAAPEAIHQVDGLTGATLTTRGVDGVVRYWLGPHGYGPFLHWLHSWLKAER
jgi:Na+-transporting NADH:ubiquinone oxidoreductase subunit C